MIEKTTMARALGLAVALFGFWLLWSGHYSLESGLILGFGVGSCALVVLLSKRMRIIDEEGQPFHLIPRVLAYLPWLIKEIIKSNLIVASKVLKPKMPLDPKILHLKPTQKTDLGRVILANSITLTPGTLTIEVRKDEITVHAIDPKMMHVEQNEMDRRVTRVEGLS